METLRNGALVVFVVLAAGAGCARRAPAVPGQARRIVPAETMWGSEAEGLQCRVRPTRRVCVAGESPAFKIDLCNRGGRVFAFVRGEQAPVHRFSIDGRWHPWPDRPPTDGRVQALGPGVEVLDLPVTLPADARPFLGPGPHVIRFAFSFEGVEVVSNSVEIEILGAR